MANNSTTNSRVPKFSKLHPIIPRRYVPEWKNDMKNRELIVKNCEASQLVSKGPHVKSLYLDKRERMNEVEPRERVEAKKPQFDRYTALRPEFATVQSKYQSSLMFRRDDIFNSQ
ncbi:sperm-associated microtubule inner protein 10-like [Antedon mediterranea]|uniref:sperm-associated microtubule inner protein 10-like n=1 Tax=Antedon mediterranea TaxID=105859 RepID=UPI003AF9AB64